MASDGRTHERKLTLSIRQPTVFLDLIPSKGAPAPEVVGWPERGAVEQILLEEALGPWLESVRAGREREMLNDQRLAFDKSFALKCLVVAHGKGAELMPERFMAQDGQALLKNIEDKWDRAEQTFKPLRVETISKKRSVSIADSAIASGARAA